MKIHHSVVRATFCCFALFLISNVNYAQDNAPTWAKKFAGKDADMVTTSVEVSDGYVIGGYSSSGAGIDKSEASRGGNDYWVIKIDTLGAKVWDKTFGGAGEDTLKKILLTTDGDLLLIGTSDSDIIGDKTASKRGGAGDYWIVKISPTGTKLWDKAYGGTGLDALSDAIPTKDGQFLLGGVSNSNAGSEKSEDARKSSEVGSNDATLDYWLVKIDANGDVLWDKTLGGDGKDELQSLSEDRLGNLFLAGKSSSKNNGDKTDLSNSSGDTWIVKLKENGEKIWDKTFGKEDRAETPVDIIVTPDNGLVVFQTAMASSGNDVSKSLIRIAPTGETIWEKALLPIEGSSFSTNKGSLQSSGNAFFLLTDYTRPNETFITTLVPVDWNGNILKNRSLLTAPKKNPSAFVITKTGKIIVAYNDYANGPADYVVAAYNLTRSVRLEAESYNGSTDVGDFPIGRISNVDFSKGKSIRIYDLGDKIHLSFTTSAGDFKIRARIRSGAYSVENNWQGPTSYFASGYKYTIDGKPVELVGIPSTVGEQNPSFGGSYWGIMESDSIALTAGEHIFEIESNKIYAGVDYIEIIGNDYSDIDAIYPYLEILAYPNPIRDQINLKSTQPILAYTLTDGYGRTILQGANPKTQEKALWLDVSNLNLPVGLYIINVNTSMGKASKRLIRK